MSVYKFRDKCDGCNEMKVLKGYEGLALCEDCIKLKQAQEEGEDNEQSRTQKQS